MSKHWNRSYAQKAIDRLLSKVDIVIVIQRYLGTGLRQRPNNKAEWIGLCPFHDEKTPSFTVTEYKQFYHCFGCGAHGNAIDFLMEWSRLSHGEAVRLLAEMYEHQLSFGKTKNTHKRRRVRVNTQKRKLRERRIARRQQVVDTELLVPRVYPVWHQPDVGQEHDSGMKYLDDDIPF